MDVPVHRRSLPSRPAGGAAGTRWRAGKATAVGLLVAMASACASGAGSGGSSGSSASSTSSTSTSSSTTAPLSAAPGATATATRTTKSVQATPSTPAKPVATESNPPGDIPDNQVFVAFHPQGAKVSVKVPEGWARTGPPSDTVFTDKLNRIEIRPGRASAPPTPTSVRNQVARLRTQVPRFAMGSVKQVSRNVRTRRPADVPGRLAAGPRHGQGRPGRLRAVHLLSLRQAAHAHAVGSDQCGQRRSVAHRERLGAVAVTSPGAGLVARNVYRFFRAGDEETLALRGVSLSVDVGETVAVVGPSGSGKTTLLSCLAGLDEPAGGSVLVCGERLSHRPEAERAALRARCVGVLLQSENLLPHLRVRENVALAQRARHRTGHPRVDDLLESVELAHRAQAYPSQLSGGELARAGLAVALANDPPVLLADE